MLKLSNDCSVGCHTLSTLLGGGTGCINCVQYLFYFPFKQLLQHNRNVCHSGLRKESDDLRLKCACHPRELSLHACEMLGWLASCGSVCGHCSVGSERVLGPTVVRSVAVQTIFFFSSLQACVFVFIYIHIYIHIYTPLHNATKTARISS